MFVVVSWLSLLRRRDIDMGPLVAAAGPLIDKGSRRRLNARVWWLRRLDGIRRCFRLVGPEEVVRQAGREMDARVTEQGDGLEEKCRHVKSQASTQQRRARSTRV